MPPTIKYLTTKNLQKYKTKNMHVTIGNTHYSTGEHWIGVQNICQMVQFLSNLTANLVNRMHWLEFYIGLTGN